MITFTRVLWKEFRAQSHVWLALTIGILLLQFLITSVMLLSESRIGNDHVQAMLAVTIVVGVCHSAASCAILFAGEREDETALFLRTFPIPRASLLGGKLTYVVLSGLAMLAVGIAMALTIAALNGSGTGPLLPNAGIIARSLIGAAAWGLLFSLLLDRVINALGFAIIAEFATVAVTGNLFGDGTRDVAYWTIVLAVLGLDLGLAARWAAGANFSLSETLSNRTAGRAARRSRWLGLLQRLAARGMPASRATGVLLWRELRSIVPFLLGFSLLGFLTVVVGMRWEGGIPFNGLFFYLIPIACGFMAGGSDQGRHTFRFLTDRGVSPYRIWTVKIATWLLAGIALTALFALVDAVANGRPDPYGRRTLNLLAEIRQNIQAPGSEPPPPGESPSVESRVLQRHFIASTWMLLFVVGQLAAFWHQKPVVGAAVGVGLSFLVSAWQFTLVAGDVPLPLASWPLVAAGLAATAYMSPQWLLEDRSWRAFGRRAAWIALPVVAVLLAARTYRIATVAVSRPTQIAWEGVKLPAGRLIDLRSPVLRELLAIDAQQALRTTGQEPLRHTVLSIVLAFREAAKSLREAGELDREWTAIRDMLAEIRRHSELVENWMEWNQCVNQTQSVLMMARDWATDPRQTDERLARAIADIRGENEILTPLPMLQNRYIRWRQFLDGQDISGSSMGEFQLSTTLMAMGIASGEIERTRRLMETITVGEMEAARELIDLSRSGRLADDQFQRYWTAAATWSSMRWAMAEPLDLYRKMQTTILLPPDLRWGGMALIVPVKSHVRYVSRLGRYVLLTFFPQQARCHLASVRGTEITLRLRRHALRHGTFPDTLDALVKDGSGAVPSDPFSDTDFLYYPAGFPLRFDINEAAGIPSGPDRERSIPAGQPLLLSVGPGDARVLHDREVGDDHLEAVPRETPLRTGFLLGDAFGELDKPDTERVRFLILD